MCRATHLLTRDLVLPILLACVTACDPSTDISEQAVFCNAVMPPLTQWDGKSLPLLQTDNNAMLLNNSPIDAKHVQAIVVDGNQITANLDIKAEQLPLLASMILGPCPQESHFGSGVQAIAISSRCLGHVVRVTTGSRPMPMGSDLASFAIETTLELNATVAQVSEMYANQVCPL